MMLFKQKCLLNEWDTHDISEQPSGQSCQQCLQNSCVADCCCFELALVSPDAVVTTMSSSLTPTHTHTHRRCTTSPMTPYIATPYNGKRAQRAAPTTTNYKHLVTSLWTHECTSHCFHLAIVVWQYCKSARGVHTIIYIVSIWTWIILPTTFADWDWTLWVY